MRSEETSSWFFIHGVIMMSTASGFIDDLSFDSITIKCLWLCSRESAEVDITTPELFTSLIKIARKTIHRDEWRGGKPGLKRKSAFSDYILTRISYVHFNKGIHRMLVEYVSFLIAPHAEKADKK